jgi:hypothetical protein
MNRPWYILTIPTKAMGLATVIYEIFFVPTADPGMLVVGAALMGMGASIDGMVGGMVEREKDPRTAQVAWLQPGERILRRNPKSAPKSFKDKVRDKHSIDDWDTLTNWGLFETEITDAILADEPEWRLEPGDKLPYVCTTEHWLRLSEQDKAFFLTSRDVQIKDPLKPKALETNNQEDEFWQDGIAKAKQLQETRKAVANLTGCGGTTGHDR